MKLSARNRLDGTVAKIKASVGHRQLVQGAPGAPVRARTTVVNGN
jgi:molybdopterin-binding protein